MILIPASNLSAWALHGRLAPQANEQVRAGSCLLRAPARLDYPVFTIAYDQIWTCLPEGAREGDYGSGSGVKGNGASLKGGS